MYDLVVGGDEFYFGFCVWFVFGVDLDVYLSV